MLVEVVVVLLVVLHILAQLAAEVRIRVVVDLVDDGPSPALDDEQLVGGIAFVDQVVADPYLRAFLTDGGHEGPPAASTHGLGFLHPADVDALRGLDAFLVVVQALEDELRARA